MDEDIGLRARKKRETENAIERAAVHLALRDGHAAVTVREICELAHISRATFFNYLPSREAAIFGRPLEMVDAEVAAAVLADLHDAEPAIIVYRLLMASAGHAQMNPVVAHGRSRLAREQDGALEAMKNQYSRISVQLTAFLIEWLGAHPEHRRLADRPVADEASLAVGLGLTAMGGVLAAQDAAEDASDDDVELSERLYREQLDAVRRLIPAAEAPSA